MRVNTSTESWGPRPKTMRSRYNFGKPLKRSSSDGALAKKYGPELTEDSMKQILASADWKALDSYYPLSPDQVWFLIRECALDQRQERSFADGKDLESIPKVANLIRQLLGLGKYRKNTYPTKEEVLERFTVPMVRWLFRTCSKKDRVVWRSYFGYASGPVTPEWSSYLREIAQAIDEKHCVDMQAYDFGVIPSFDRSVEYSDLNVSEKLLKEQIGLISMLRCFRDNVRRYWCEEKSKLYQKMKEAWVANPTDLDQFNKAF